jgi:LacI family transcriptional regulator
VKELALQMGYQPNIVASNLRNSKTNTIGVIVPHINRPFIAAVISGVEQVANEAGYHVLISQTNDLYEKEVDNALAMFANRVEGLIISLAMETTDYMHFDAFQKKGIPLIFFDRVSTQLPVTEHLIRQGCRRIAYLAGSQKRENYLNRLKGYVDALRKYNLVVEEDLILYNYLSREEGWEAAKSLLQQTPLIDGIISANDTAAVSMIQVLKEKGYKIPEDIAVAGFNDDPVATIIEPALTTVAYPAYLMGQKAMQQFIAMKENVNKDAAVAETIVLPTELLIRASSRRVSK